MCAACWCATRQREPGSSVTLSTIGVLCRWCRERVAAQSARPQVKRIGHPEDGAERMTGDASLVTDTMWATVCLSVNDKVKALFNRQRPPEGVDVDCDEDRCADVFASRRAMRGPPV